MSFPTLGYPGEWNGSRKSAPSHDAPCYCCSSYYQRSGIITPPDTYFRCPNHGQEGLSGSLPLWSRSLQTQAGSGQREISKHRRGLRCRIYHDETAHLGSRRPEYGNGLISIRRFANKNEKESNLG